MNRLLVQVFLLSSLVVFALPPGTGGQKVEDVRVEEQKPENDFSYVLRGKQRPCILANMTIRIKVPYTKENKTEDKILEVAKDARVEGNCASVISNLKLSWKGGTKDTDKNNTIQLIFINDNSKFSIFSINLTVYQDKDNFPPSVNTIADKDRWLNAMSDMDLRLFAASVTNGIHKCDKETKVKVGATEISFKNVSLIAFNTDDDLSTKKGEQCDGNKNDAKTFPYVLNSTTTNSSCMLARMTTSFSVSYKTKNSTNTIKSMAVPITANVMGNCEPTVSSMELVWNASSQSKQTFALAPGKNAVKFYFYKEKESTYLDIVYVNIYLDEKNFPDAANVNERISQLVKFDEPLAPAENGLYNCPKNVTLKLNERINMTINDVILVAFDVQKDFASKRVGDCRTALSKDNFRYVVENPEAEVPCTLANMSIDIRVPYRKADTNANRTLSVPISASTRGTCDRRGEMELSWPESVNNKIVMDKIIFYIAQNKTHFFVYNIEGSIYLDEKHFPDATNKNALITGLSDMNLNVFAAPLDKGLYSCLNQTQEIELKNFTLILTNVSFVAFNTDEYMNSKEVRSCASPGGDVTPSPTTPSTTSVTPSTTQSTAPTPSTNPPEPNSPVDFNYVVVNATTHLPCIVANMSISVKVPFATKESNKTTSLKVPKTAKAFGTCKEPTSTMELIWSNVNSSSTAKTEGEENIVAITFEKRESEYSIHSIDLDIYMDEQSFPGALDKRYKAVTENLTVFSAPLNNVYKCKPETVLRAKSAGITISNVALMAFNSEKTVASRSVNCVAESGSNVGAIVGGVIASVAVLGLIGFLFVMYKRKRRLA
ncbi:PREDICTED: uncharacterized protein LOC108555372 [Eufriesea mexicana]|uniref:uncharacterized protein LOC108555372 n=1 Tax=Eufriesea mexicana TaxID=516756 RepID=UPI00083C556C|nr:PREDICTED: uncharacterized protein LOC108555372 [Eufriesea mexicana]